jgi:hypothetical protein
MGTRRTNIKAAKIILFFIFFMARAFPEEFNRTVRGNVGDKPSALSYDSPVSI